VEHRKRQRSCGDRLRPLRALDEHLQHPDRAHDADRTALLPRRQVHCERNAGLPELRRVAGLVLQVLADGHLPEEEHRGVEWGLECEECEV